MRTSQRSYPAPRGAALALLGVALGGCKSPPRVDHLAGVPLAAAPHFHHTQVFLEGEDLYVALDPTRYPDKVGSGYEVHVVEHKNHAQWSSDPSLTDVSGGTESGTLTAGDLAANQVLAWPSMSLPAGNHRQHAQYDVVFDFNGNGRWDPGLDVLDRVGVLERAGAEESGGFTLVADPTQPGDFPVATHEYDLGGFEVAVPLNYQENGDPKTIQLVGRLYYPATRAGVDQPISTDRPSYPLVVIAHGRHGGSPESFKGYDYLGEHLASRGYVCASVALHELVTGWRIHHRGVAILEHVQRIALGPTSDATMNSVRARIDPRRVGLLGHARGGEGVVAAQSTHARQDAPAFSIRAVVSLSPTDGPNWSEATPGGGPYDPVVPYLMIYGTRDGDLSGYAGNTGFRIHDRARRPRHLVNIHGANHNFFNATWSEDGDPTITREEQELLTKGLVTPFFADQLLGRQAYVELLSGFVQPASMRDVGAIVQYSSQPLRWMRFVVDDSQDVPADPATNSLGGGNTAAGLSAFAEEGLRYHKIPTPNYYAHDTDGLRAAWSSRNGSLSFGVGRRDVRHFDFLSFRIGQRYRARGGLNPDGAQDLSVTLVDSKNVSSPKLAVSTYAELHPVDAVGPYTKSVMQTVRIPLRAFTANGSDVNLGRIDQIRFDFDRSASGELIIDDVEFLGLDITEPE